MNHFLQFLLGLWMVANILGFAAGFHPKQCPKTQHRYELIVPAYRFGCWISQPLD